MLLRAHHMHMPQALRDAREALLTVIAVVLYDPLYKWQMTPVRAQRRQQDPIAGDDAGGGGGGTATTCDSAAAGADASSRGGGGSSAAPPPPQSAAAAAAAAAANAAEGAVQGLGNADAERAVLRVKQKLEGHHDAEAGAALSVGAQVGRWLAEAQDPGRLAAMFLGWAAWL